ncbi:hypothetical protein C8J57DRAFT_1720556 [Mycena rebaudengoi]|nr:hypothetical protein C8J57DRAFT_1720556 [Mycena rebaudengoi]
MSPQRTLAELVARSLGSLLRAPRRWRSFCLPTRWRDRPCVHIFEGPPASFWFPPSPAALGPLCGAHTMRNCAVAFGFGADNGYASRNRVRWRTCRSVMPLHALSIARVREAGRSSRQVSAIVRGRLGVVPGPCTPPSMPARRMYAWARDHTPEQGIDADTVRTDADDSVHVPAPSVSHSLFHTGSPSTPKQRRGVSAASPPLAYSRPWRHARIAQRRTGAIRRSRAPHAGGSERPAGAPSPQAHAVARHILATVASVIKPARAIPAGSQKCACGGGEHRRPLRRPQRCLLTYAHTRPRTCDTSICGQPAPAIPANSTKEMTRTQTMAATLSTSPTKYEAFIHHQSLLTTKDISAGKVTETWLVLARVRLRAQGD